MDEKYEKLQNAIFGGDKDTGHSEAVSLVEGGISPLDVFTQCIEPTLVTVGDRFSRLEIFLPEMIKSADVVKVIQAALLPFMEEEGEDIVKGRVVIGTVSGDLHDIGKNIVRTMLEVNGFDVKDLGVDVSPTEVVNAAADFEADIVALSALMLPSLPYAGDTIEMIKGNEKYIDRFKIMVGGGPVSREWVEGAGADGYGDDAIEAVQVALALMDAPA